MDGKEFQKKLKELGITQAKVADILGVTRQTISAMKRNASVKLSNLEKIAAALGKDISMFLEDEEVDANYQALLKAKDEKIKELESTISRLIGIIEKLQQ